ncbi:hypothetical protein [Pedobacter jejuensis]|uniref:Lipoprotein n=1 Tax=Pedobacter jejuensis TaxID=1268550 RepID=A0A3N0BWQ7_9SPHI|nr:hypothetical protein [Pedobacter jejuensis]RNL54149.1 hypothetical protein D7004_08625 [Pedobacter jejuensis]
MKKILNLSLLMIVMFSISCKKNSNDEKIEIDTNNLTTCPKDFNCTYLYHDAADFGEPFFLNLKKGSYKVFKYSALLGYGNYAKYVYMRIPMNVTQFSLTNKQVLAGEVKFANPCTSCNTIGVKIVGGSFKGIKTSTSFGVPKWLLDGQLYLGSITPSAYRDTIRIKQYFTLDPTGI